MSLPIPIVGQTPDQEWANDVNQCLTIIDAHSHDSGSGVIVNTEAISIDNALSFNGYDANNLRTTTFLVMSATLGSSVSNALYDVSGSLWFNNGAGVAVQLTQGGNIVSSGSTGTFGTKSITSNLTVPAGATYNVIFVDTTAPRTITLPSAAAVGVGKCFWVYDVSGNAGINNISLVPNGTDTIAGTNSTFAMSNNYGAWQVQCDGSGGWWLLYDQSFNANNFTGPPVPPNGDAWRGMWITVRNNTNQYNNMLENAASASVMINTLQAAGFNFIVMSDPGQYILSGGFSLPNVKKMQQFVQACHKGGINVWPAIDSGFGNSNLDLQQDQQGFVKQFFKPIRDYQTFCETGMVGAKFDGVFADVEYWSSGLSNIDEQQSVPRFIDMMVTLKRALGLPIGVYFEPAGQPPFPVNPNGFYQQIQYGTDFLLPNFHLVKHFDIAAAGCYVNTGSYQTALLGPYMSWVTGSVTQSMGQHATMICTSIATNTAGGFFGVTGSYFGSTKTYFESQATYISNMFQGTGSCAFGGHLMYDYGSWSVLLP